MGTPKAVVILFQGGEISKEQIDKLRFVICECATPESIRIATYDADEIAQLAMHSTLQIINQVEPENQGVKIRIHTESRESRIQKQISKGILYVVDNFGGNAIFGEIPLLEMVNKYISDKDCKKVFQTLAKTSKEEFFENEHVSELGVSNVFYETIKNIVTQIR